MSPTEPASDMADSEHPIAFDRTVHAAERPQRHSGGPPSALVDPTRVPALAATSVDAQAILDKVAVEVETTAPGTNAHGRPAARAAASAPRRPGSPTSVVDHMDCVGEPEGEHQANTRTLVDPAAGRLQTAHSHARPHSARRPRASVGRPTTRWQRS